MKCAVIGAGGVGGYIGGRLAEAGHDVTFLARGAHLEAIRNNGLEVKSISGDFHVLPALATDRVEEVGAVDVVLCCVKSWQVAEAAAQMKPLIGPGTVVIPVQNGVEAHSTMAETVDPQCIVPGLCKMISMVDGPGRIRHAGIDPYLAFGELEGQLSPRVSEIGAAFSQARGLAVEPSGNILQQLWLKFMIIAPWSGVGALTRSPIGVFRSLAKTRELLLGSVREVFDVAQAHGVGLEEGAVEATMNFFDQAPPQGSASMQRDIMEGRPSELHEQCGAVVRYGEKGTVPTPVNQFIYSSLLPLESKARGEITF